MKADSQALCRRLARHGPRWPLISTGMVLIASPAMRSDVRPSRCSSRFPTPRVLADAARGLDLLRKLIGATALAVVGLRIGGRYALLVAARERLRISAAVSYYGAGSNGAPSRRSGR